MTAIFILKCILTIALVLGNFGYLLLVILAGSMDTKGEWDHSTNIFMIVPTMVNALILWSMWE